MKTSIIVLAFIMSACNQQAGNAVATTAQKQQEKSSASVYQFSVPALEGGNIHFSDFKGKKILIGRFFLISQDPVVRGTSQ